MMVDKPKKYEDVLRAALQFDEDDLAVNAAGKLSAAQMRTLTRGRSQLAVIFAITYALIVLVVLFLGSYLGAGVTVPLLLITGLFALITFMSSTMKAMRFARDFRDGVQVVEGRVQLDANTGEQAGEFFVKLDKLKFKVNKESFLAFKNGDPYRIYYAPHSKTILSAEWLRDDDPFDEELPTRKRRLEDAPISEDHAAEAHRIVTDDGELREDARR